MAEGVDHVVEGDDERAAEGDQGEGGEKSRAVRGGIEASVPSAVASGRVLPSCSRSYRVLAIAPAPESELEIEKDGVVAR
jgi:hypothetical protein